MTHNYCQKKGWTKFLILILLTSTALRAEAQLKNDSLTHVNLDTLVVSGIKLSNKQWMLPISATTVSGDVLQNKQLTEMKDFIGYIPNFIMLDRDSKRTSSVFVRGIGTLVNTPGVAMYVDGVPHFEKSSFDINLTDVESIEFLRGPQGTLYGRNAMGGIILVNTKSPFVHQGTRLNLRLGSYTDLYASVSHLGKVNDGFAYGISADIAHFGGYIPNVYSGTKADKMDYSASVNSRLEWRPANNLSFRLVNSFEKVKQGAFTYGDLNEEGYVDSVSTNHKSFYDRKIYDGGLQIDYRNPHFWLRSQTSAQVLNDVYDVDQDASPKDLYYAVQSEDQFLLSQEINLRGLNTGFYNWHVGVFAFNHNIGRNTDVYMNMMKPPYKLEKTYDDFSRGFAVYHQSDVYFTPNLKLEAGIRYDFERANSVYVENKIVDGNAELRNEYDSPLTFSEWSPKVSLQYFFAKNAQVYATVAKGYKTGGFNTVFKTEDQRTFKPETSWNYEAGAKASFLENRLNTQFALFYIDITDQQIKQLLELLGIQIFNAGNSVSKGVEFSLQAIPSRQFNFNLAYGYTHATFTNYVYSPDVDYSGKFVPFVPQHTLSAGAQFILPAKSAISDEIRFNANYRGMGKIYWNEDNEKAQDFYGLLDGNIAVQKKNVTFALWAKNITNTKYLGYYFTMSKRQLGKPGRPFTAGVSLSLSF